MTELDETGNETARPSVESEPLYFFPDREVSNVRWGNSMRPLVDDSGTPS